MGWGQENVCHPSTHKCSNLSLCKNKVQSDSVTKITELVISHARLRTRADSRFSARSAASAGGAWLLVPVVTSVPGLPRMRGTQRDSLWSLRRDPAKGCGCFVKCFPQVSSRSCSLKLSFPFNIRLSISQETKGVPPQSDHN